MDLISLQDILIVAAFVALVGAFIFLLRKEKVVALILSIYLAFIFTEEFSILNSSVLRLKVLTINPFIFEILFLIMAGFFFLLFVRSGFFRSYAKSHYGQGGGKIYFLNIFAVGLFMAISIRYFLPANLIFGLGDFLKMIFISPFGFFIWVVTPLFGIFLVKKRN